MTGLFFTHFIDGTTYIRNCLVSNKSEMTWFLDAKNPNKGMWMRANSGFTFIFRSAGPLSTVLCVGKCVGAWSIFETRSVQLLHKFLGESIIPADLLRPCRHFLLCLTSSKVIKKLTKIKNVRNFLIS